MAAPQGIERDPMLSGIYAPVEDEIEVADLEVEGELPRGLQGTYLRNGANPKFEPAGRYHLFVEAEGDATEARGHRSLGRVTVGPRETVFRSCRIIDRPHPVRCDQPQRRGSRRRRR